VEGRDGALRRPDAAAQRPNQKTLGALNGLSVGQKGQRKVAMPQGWDEVEAKLSASTNAEIRAQAQALSLTFGSTSALASLKKTLTDKSADVNARRTALDSLLQTKTPELPPILQELLSDANLRAASLRALASFDDPQTPADILTVYSALSVAEKRDALNTLAARTAYARALLAAVGQNKVEPKELTAELIRQLRNLKDPEIDAQLTKVWGVARDSTADKQQEIEKYRAVFRAGGSQPGDALRGRVVRGPPVSMAAGKCPRHDRPQ
jgi:hypothetical protein